MPNGQEIERTIPRKVVLFLDDENQVVDGEWVSCECYDMVHATIEALAGAPRVDIYVSDELAQPDATDGTLVFSNIGDALFTIPDADLSAMGTLPVWIRFAVSSIAGGGIARAIGVFRST